MAQSVIAPNSRVIRWKKKFFREFVRENRFNKYMGDDAASPIQLITDLTKARGDTISIPLFTKLKSAGVTGSQTLRGNEEALSNYEDRIKVDQIRNGVQVPEFEQQRTEVELLDVARPMLMDWAKEKLRDDLIQGMFSPNQDGITTYANTSEALKNAWLTANVDRILFGQLIANSSSLVHATALATVDSTNDKLTTGALSTMKRMLTGTTASRAVRPIRVNDDEEWYVVLAHRFAFRDLQSDPVMQQANRDARPRNVSDNPLFTGGDLVWNGFIIREVPEIPTIVGVGTAGIDVAPCFVLGAQAMGVAWAKRTDPIEDLTDYGDKAGIGIREWRGVKKLTFDGKQHGMGTLYVSGVADG